MNTEDAEHDFLLIFDHLFDAYSELGDPPEDAMERAAARIGGLREEINRLTDTPNIGTLRPDIYPQIRFLRRDRAAVWFLLVEERHTIFVAAVFYGAQDHIRHMLTRLLGE